MSLSSLYDKGGIDGPFNRYMSRPIYGVEPREQGAKLPACSESLEKILRYVCALGHVTRERAVSKVRSFAVVKVRHLYYYLARNLTDCTLEQIGEHAGASDHTTVLYGLERVIEAGRLDEEKGRESTPKLILRETRKAFGLELVAS